MLATMPRYAANLKWLFTELPFLDRFAAAAAHGFKGVEYASPYDYPAQVLQARLRDEGLEQVLINTPAAPPGHEGENGFACIPGQKQAFRLGMSKAIDHAQALGCGLIHLQAGRLPHGVSWSSADSTLRDNLAWASDSLQGTGIRCVLECLNQADAPGYFFRSVSHAASYVESCASNRVGLLFDVYHCAQGGEDILARFEALRPLILHIQVADSPGRHEPGTGDVPWPALLDLLRAHRYDGWIGCEYRPREETTAGLNWRSCISHPVGGSSS